MNIQQSKICIDAKECFEGASGINLNGLQYNKAENKFEWEKEKRQISSKPSTTNPVSEAEANICVDAKELFDGASGISLNGLQYTKAENKFEWEKEKRQIFSKP